MRNFYVFIYRNLLWIYLCGVFCLGYQMFMESVPSNIYVRRGEEVHVSCSLPVKLVYNGTGERAAMREMDGGKESSTMTCYLFGILPVKQIQVHVAKGQEAYVSGRLIGIYEQTLGVLVLKTAALRNNRGVEENPAGKLVMSGDYITGFNGSEIHSKEELVEQVAANGAKPATLTLLRQGKEQQVTVTPLESSEHRYFLGIWVKDDMAGIGTLSYFREDGSFGALGHGIGDGETGELLSVEDGRIYSMTLTGITKGKAGAPGALEGMIFYGKDSCLGAVHSNSEIGIYGRLDQEDLDLFAATGQKLPVAYKQEVTQGKAWILSEVSGEPDAYEISITGLSYEPSDLNKGIRFEVTDERLLDLTGGIVQGMSGSPILQDGRLIGAVTHVLVGSPEKGYGVFIETMLEED